MTIKQKKKQFIHTRTREETVIECSLNITHELPLLDEILQNIPKYILSDNYHYICIGTAIKNVFRQSDAFDIFNEKYSILTDGYNTIEIRYCMTIMTQVHIVLKNLHYNNIHKAYQYYNEFFKRN